LVSKEKIYYLIGLIGSRSPFFLLIPILSFYFTKSEVGKLDLILVTVILLIPIVTLQLGEATFRFLKEFLNSKTKIISTAISGLLINSLFFLLLCYFLFIWFRREEILWFLIIFLSSLIVNNLLLIFRGLNNIKSYALLGILSGSISLLLIFFFLTNSTTLLDIAILFGIGHIIAVLISIVESSILEVVRISSISKNLLFVLLVYSLPLIPNAISWWFIDLGNRYIISLTLGEEYLGIFAVAARYIVLIAFINNFFLLLWQDTYLKNRIFKDELKDNFNQFIDIQLSIIIFVTSISYFLIKFGAGSEFIDSYKFVAPISISLFISSLSAYAGVEYLKTKKTKLLFFSTLKGGILNVIVALLLVNFLGLYGIVLGSITGFFFTFYIRLKHSTKLQLLYRPIFEKLVIGLFIVIIIYLVQLYGNQVLKILTSIIVLLSLIYWNRKIISNKLKK
jgi:O-antigen/teichoic acid export membrane protein